MKANDNASKKRIMGNGSHALARQNQARRERTTRSEKKANSIQDIENRRVINSNRNEQQGRGDNDPKTMNLVHFMQEQQRKRQRSADHGGLDSSRHSIRSSGTPNAGGGTTKRGLLRKLANYSNRNQDACDAPPEAPWRVENVIASSGCSREWWWDDSVLYESSQIQRPESPLCTSVSSSSPDSSRHDEEEEDGRHNGSSSPKLFRADSCNNHESGVSTSDTTIHDIDESAGARHFHNRGLEAWEKARVEWRRKSAAEHDSLKTSDAHLHHIDQHQLAVQTSCRPRIHRRSGVSHEMMKSLSKPSCRSYKLPKKIPLRDMVDLFVGDIWDPRDDSSSEDEQ